MSTISENTDVTSPWKEPKGAKILNVNAHVHTPYSFSAFKNITEIFQLANEQDVKVLGINDFYSTDGYEEFSQRAGEFKIFPLFNIEFIGVNQKDKEKGLRLNDPGNPGRVYMSGKGLNYPPKLDEPYASQVNEIKQEVIKRVSQMLDKTNILLSEIGSDIKLCMDEIFEKYAVDLVRERHVAKALRIKVFEKFVSVQERTEFFKKLYDGQMPGADLESNVSVENEIRNMLFKAGKKAFVEEGAKAFLPIKLIKEIILNAGGIPTYPLLADDAKGDYTAFERDKEVLLKELKDRNVHSVEFIPNRNNLDLLKEYAMFFWKNGVLVTFGTEHNSPDMIPMKVETRGGVDLDDELKSLSYQGACVVAAHQYLKSKGQEGYVKENGERNGDSLQPFVEIGHEVITKFIQ
ncbi:PHP domain-containing protein [Plebeiibacterium marinum]|uniref:PHP domain-containing protein n=1 Tax=Plebeiibacterium marinum TaxID=2992111 RepID=A0AAE3SKH0_9BACT|nr:PHP domain-containing protein [Plebeiobacterium marinum]MCW3806855.1 PHP domain-containing protein [Plebeiobacterium marinum]